MRKQKFFTRTVISALIASGLAVPAFAASSVPVGGVNVTLGGFLASETAYRSKSLLSDISSNYANIPFQGSATDNRYNQSEFRGTERQSRFSIKAQGRFSPSIVVTGYYEMDFLAAAATANQNQSNSFSPRTRHVFGAIDWLDSGTHLLFGQTWSLATLESKGLDGKHGWTPLTIDAQYVPGFTWTRQWQTRLSQEFGNGLWGAISIENSQTHGAYGAAKSAVSNSSGSTLGGSLYSSNPTYNKYPDVVVKFAADTGFGHYEAYALNRDFQAANTLGNTGSTDKWATSFGIGAIIPLVPKTLEFEGDYLSGKGVGRYGTVQLSDAIYSAGVAGAVNVTPVKGSMYLLGLKFNATPDWVLYANNGEEKVNGDAGNGFGDGFGGALSTSGTALLKSVKQSTIGFWWTAYKGAAGKVKFGMQYSTTKAEAFSGGAFPATASTSSTDNMWFTSLRYYPGY